MREITSITDTIIDLGTVISKSVLNLWLKDADIAKDISLGVADILGKKIKDSKARRPSARFFERIADEVSCRLEPIILRLCHR